MEEWKRKYQLPQLNWATQSIDLSPIENIWLLFKNEITNKPYLIHTTNDLEHKLLHVWKEKSLIYIQNLYESIPRRCRHVIIQKGDIPKY